MSRSQVTVHCRRCGSEQFKIPHSPPPPGDVITCAGCGSSGKYRDLQKEAVELAKAHVEQVFRDAFKGSKLFKLR